MFVEVTRKVMVRMKKDAARRIADCQERGLCLACLQPLKSRKGRIIRGVHESCRKLLEKHYADLSVCVAEGKLLASQPGRKPTNPISVEAASE